MQELIPRSLLLASLAAPAATFAAELVDVASLPQPRAGIAAGDIHRALGLAPEELDADSSARLPNGTRVTRRRQFYKGVRVWGEAITNQRPRPQRSERMLVGIEQDLPRDATPTLTREQAAAGQGLVASALPPRNEQSELVVRQDEQGQAQLAYVVSFFLGGAKPSPALHDRGQQRRASAALGRPWPMPRPAALAATARPANTSTAPSTAR